MDRSEKIAFGCVLAYLAVAIVTFGHSASAHYREDRSDYAQCRAEQVTNARVICIDDSSEKAGTAGSVAGLLWPLYWSWEAWS
jgi:hypothetical protein